MKAASARGHEINAARAPIHGPSVNLLGEVSNHETGQSVSLGYAH